MGPFGHSSMSYHQLANGIPADNWQPYAGMPGGPAVQLVAGMLGDSWAQKAGMANFGFQTHQNVYDMMKQKAMFERNKGVLQAAAHADRASFEQTISGAFTMAGVDMSDPARQAEVRKLSESAASMSGMFAQMAPEWFDAMHGQRGSSAVMAHYMTQAGRYRIDPVTGTVGMSGQSIADQANLVHSQLYSGDNYMRMKGVRAGEAGRMYDELTRKGMMPGPLSGQSLTRGALAHMASQGTLDQAYNAAGITAGTDVSSLTPAQVQRLESVQGVQDARSDPTVIASANAKRTAGKLEEWAGAVSAMKEIFGDAGHPNAPMPEILNALEQMTSGTMQQMSPQRVEGLVRKMNNLSKTSGMTLEATMQMMQTVQGIQKGVGFGNNAAAFSADITMSSMAFRSSLDLSQPAWGRSTADQLALTDAQLREQARGSMMTNHMAVIARLGGTGVFAGAEGADARELMAAMSGPNRNNARVIELMKKHNLTNESQLTEWLQSQSGGRLGSAQIATTLADRYGNQEYANRSQFQNITREAQFSEEVAPALTDSYAGAFSEKLDDAGAAKAGDIMMKSLLAMKEQGYNRDDAAQRNSYIASALIKAAETDPSLAAFDIRGKSDDEIKKIKAMARAQAETAWAAGGRISQNEFNLTQADAFALGDQSTLEQASNREMSAEMEAVLQGTVAHVGKGTLMEKVVTAFQSMQGKSDDEIKKGLGTVLGNVDKEKLGPLMDALKQRQEQVAAFETSPEFVAYKAELTQIDEQIRDAEANNDTAKVKALQDKKAALQAGSGGRFARMQTQLQNSLDNIFEMGTKAGVDLKAVSETTPATGTDGSVARVEFPKDGVQIAGKIVIEDNREPQFTGTMTGPGAAPNAGQAPKTV